MSARGKRYVWRKLSSAKWEDVWPERLSAFADRLAITAIRGRKSIKVEVFNLSAKEAAGLEKAFAGMIAERKSVAEMIGQPVRKPILVRGRLAVISEPKQAAKIPAKHRVLVIPAGMAFGTGEHSTTLMCLREIADAADAMRGRTWSAVDIGCGSGILALAAASFGAGTAEGFDNDPDCVRTARANAAANGLHGVKFSRRSLDEWTPRRRWNLISANLFSRLLIEHAPHIAAALEPGGTLVFSGVLRDQIEAVIAALESADFQILSTAKRGKWCCASCTISRT